MVMDEKNVESTGQEHDAAEQPQAEGQPNGASEVSSGEQTNPSVDSGEQDIFEAASHATDSTEYSQYMPLRKPKKKWPKVVGLVLLGLIVLAAVGAGGFVLAKHFSSSKPAAQTNSKAKQQNTQASSGSQPQTQPQTQATTTTKQYTSTNLKLSFSYPDKWVVVDSGGGKLTVTSPSTQLTGADGQTQTGEIIMQVENQASADMSAFKTGSAVAVLPSQKIAYSNPTGTQRANTYLSFLQYAATTTHGALDGVYITGNLGYTKGQTIPESDVAKVDPLVRVVFVKCSDTKCSSTTPLSISSDAWNDSSFNGPIVTMLKSLAIQ